MAREKAALTNQNNISAAALVWAILILAVGIAIGLASGRWSQMSWENRMDWVAVLGLAGAVLNALVIWVVSVSITHKLEERTVGRRFEKDLVGGFGRAAFQATDKIHDFFHECMAHPTFSNDDRQQMVLLFSALAQEILLIEEAIRMCGLEGSGLDITTVQLCRGEYKDVLTDHDTQTPISPDEVKAEGVKYAAVRKALVILMVAANRAS